MPALKEPQFYCTDLPRLAQVNDRESYEGLFAAALPEQLKGEGSVWYLFSSVAAERLLADSPRARLVVMLRNPIDMAHSLHAQLLSQLREDVIDFEDAWARQPARRRGEQLPRHCREPATLLYREVCSFAPQLERLFQQAPREQVQVLLFEEFFADPRAGYRAVLDFLGLQDDDRQDFPRINVSQFHRNQLVVDLINGLPQWTDPVLEGVRRFANQTGLRPMRALKRMNARPTPRQPLSPAFRAKLAREFAPDVRATELLLGRSLDVWRDAMNSRKGHARESRAEIA